MNTPTPKSEYRRLSLSSWKYLLVEFLVVFSGVFVAYLVNDIKDQKSHRENQLTYYAAFDMAINQHLNKTIKLKEEIDHIISTLEVDSTAPIDFPHSLDYTQTVYIVETVFGSDRFAGVDADFMVSLELGANDMKMVDNRIKSLKDKVFFAQTSSNILQEPFKKWYLGELRYLSNHLDSLIYVIDKKALPSTRRLIQNLEEGNR